MKTVPELIADVIVAYQGYQAAVAAWDAAYISKAQHDESIRATAKAIYVLLQRLGLAQ